MHSTTKRSAVLAGVAALALGAVAVPGIAPTPAHAAGCGLDNTLEECFVGEFDNQPLLDIILATNAQLGVTADTTVEQASYSGPLIQQIDTTNPETSVAALEKLDGIDRLASLKTLKIVNDAVEPIPLSSLGPLRTTSQLLNDVTITNARITDAGLDDLASQQNHLVNLNLEDNEITDASRLNDFRQLETVNLSGNALTKAPAFENSRGTLRELDLDNNAITDVSALESGDPGNTFSSLETLWLGENELSGQLPSGIFTLNSLKSLDISANNLTNIDMVSALSRLTELFASHNQIVDASFVSRRPTLVTLELHNNEIESAPTPAENSALKNLTIGHNHIRDLQPLAPIIEKLDSFGGEGQTVDLGTVELPSGHTSTLPTATIPGPKPYVTPNGWSPAGGTYIEDIGEVAWDNVTQSGPFSVDFSVDILPTLRMPSASGVFSGTITQQVNVVTSAIATWEFQNGSPARSQAVNVGQSITPIEDPTRDGFTFAGWALDAAGTQPAEFPFVMNADTTFYAQWTPVPVPTPTPTPTPTPSPKPGPVADTGAAGVRMAAGLAGTLITAGIGAIGMSRKNGKG